MTAHLSDSEIIDAFRSGGQRREQAWAFAYAAWRDRAIGVIVKKGGQADDARAAMHEVAGVFERAVSRPGFVLEHRLSSYFVTCAVRRWARRQKQPLLDELDDRHMAELVESTEAQIAQNDLSKILDDSLGRIGGRCRDILRLFMDGHSMREIAERMAFAGGEQVARNEKAKCQARYEGFLRENPRILLHIQNLRQHG